MKVQNQINFKLQGRNPKKIFYSGKNWKWPILQGGKALLTRNFMCLQEINWVREKAKELDSSLFKCMYTDKVRSENGIGIIVNKE